VIKENGYGIVSDHLGMLYRVDMFFSLTPHPSRGGQASAG